jgi:hypothetical protein
LNIHNRSEEDEEETEVDGPADINSLVNPNPEGGGGDESELAFSVSSAHLRGGVGGSLSGRRVEMTQIDPIRWREETDRMIPALRKAEKSLNESFSFGSSWQAHVGLLDKYYQQTALPAFQQQQQQRGIAVPVSNNNTRKNHNNPNPNGDSFPLIESLQFFQSRVTSDRQQLSSSERLLNNRKEFETMFAQYKSHKEVSEEEKHYYSLSFFFLFCFCLFFLLGLG